MPGLSRLTRWLLLGEWGAHPVRALVAIAAIAVGVSMGFAIHLINAAAFNEFSAAVKSLSGQADIQVQGRELLLTKRCIRAWPVTQRSRWPRPSSKYRPACRPRTA